MEPRGFTRSNPRRTKTKSMLCIGVQRFSLSKSTSASFMVSPNQKIIQDTRKTSSYIGTRNKGQEEEDDDENPYGPLPSFGEDKVTIITNSTTGNKMNNQLNSHSSTSNNSPYHDTSIYQQHHQQQQLQQQQGQGQPYVPYQQNNRSGSTVSTSPNGNIRTNHNSRIGSGAPLGSTSLGRSPPSSPKNTYNPSQHSNSLKKQSVTLDQYQQLNQHQQQNQYKDEELSDYATLPVLNGGSSSGSSVGSFNSDLSDYGALPSRASNNININNGNFGHVSGSYRDEDLSDYGSLPPTNSFNRMSLSTTSTSPKSVVRHTQQPNSNIRSSTGSHITNGNQRQTFGSNQPLSAFSSYNNTASDESDYGPLPSGPGLTQNQGRNSVSPTSFKSLHSSSSSGSLSGSTKTMNNQFSVSQFQSNVGGLNNSTKNKLTLSSQNLNFLSSVNNTRPVSGEFVDAIPVNDTLGDSDYGPLPSFK